MALADENSHVCLIVFRKFHSLFILNFESFNVIPKLFSVYTSYVRRQELR